MILWLISQTTNNDYDTFDSAVVAALTEDDARHTHPSDGPWNRESGREWSVYGWAPLENVSVRKIGIAPSNTEPGVIIASYNAG